MEKFGIPTAFGLVLASMFFFLLKWVLEQSKAMLNQMAKEREAWLSSLKALNDQMLIAQQCSTAFFNQVIDAHKYQREEHKDMITTLGRINGYKND